MSESANQLDDLTKARAEIEAEAKKMIDSLEGKAPNEEQTEKLRSLDEKWTEANTAVTAERERAGTDEKWRSRAEATKTAEEAARETARAPIYGRTGDEEGKELEEFAKAAITPGELFTRSPEYQEWMSKNRGGAPSVQTTVFSGQHDVGPFRSMLGLTDATTKMRGALTPEKFRTLLTSNDNTAGTLVNSLRRGLIEPGLVRPLTIRDLVTVIPVTTDTIEYVRELSRSVNAAPVVEASAVTGTTGTKPEGGVIFEQKSDVVQTIAEWVPVTKRIIADAPALRAYIDGYLTYDLALELEDQIITGSGSGANFRGILNTSGTLTQTGATNKLDNLRAAKRKVVTTARTNPNAVVVNPVDMEAMDVLKAGAGTANDGGGPYYGQSPWQYNGNDRIWGMPIVESEAISAGTALVGDFSRSILFDRESTNISVGTAGDDFIRNIVRVLAELRAGFGVIRPSAFCIVTY